MKYFLYIVARRTVRYALLDMVKRLKLSLQKQSSQWRRDIEIQLKIFPCYVLLQIARDLCLSWLKRFLRFVSRASRVRTLLK